MSKLTCPTAAPKSKRTLACGSPKVTASNVKLYVVLVVVMFAVSVTLVQGPALNPKPAKIGLFVSDHASNVSVYELPVMISTFWLVFTAPGSYIVAVTAANRSTNLETRFSIWITQDEPVASGSDPEDYRYYIVKDGVLPPSGSYESWRFTMIADDELYVSSNNGKASFSVSGINQSV